LLHPWVLPLFSALFGPSLGWNLPEEPLCKGINCSLIRDVFGWIFLLYSNVVCMNGVSPLIFGCKLWVLWLMLAFCKLTWNCLWIAWRVHPSSRLFIFWVCLTMTMLPWWGVIVGFALLFPLSPRVSLLLANNPIAKTVAPATHHISADHEVAWILWVLASCELFG
jgi:hypothetical protein